MSILEGNLEAGKGLPRTFQRACLLIGLSGGASHGYELLDRVRRMGLRSAEAGGLYRCLRAMEADRMVTSWWEPSQSGPPRRTYALTDIGNAALASAVDELNEVRLLLDGVLAGVVTAFASSSAAASR
ncbi:MAG: PadR family transcriptional regulator [Acidimicrobiales bacterium]